MAILNHRNAGVMNLKIKFRESFRPFAPACCAKKRRVFRFDRGDPHMLLVAPVAIATAELTAAERERFGMKLLTPPRRSRR
jgi:carbamoyltransferase